MPKKQPQKSRQPRSKTPRTRTRKAPAKAPKKAAAAPGKMGIQVLNDAGKTVETLPLHELIASSETDSHLIYQAAVAAQAIRRLGTVKTTNRSEVSGGGKKPWKQKGTGRARHGSIRSPLWRKGGTTFGPRPRDYRIELSQTTRSRALVAGLKDKAKEGKFYMVEDFRSKDGKTKGMAAIITRWPCRKPVIVTEERHLETLRSVRNIPNVEIRTSRDLAAMDIFESHECVMTRKGYDRLIDRLKGKPS